MRAIALVFGAAAAAVLLAACSTTPSHGHAQGISAQPSAIGGSASVVARCEPGVESPTLASDGTVTYAGSFARAGVPATYYGTSYPLLPAYEVQATNDSAKPLSTTGWAATFYSLNHSQVGTDIEGIAIRTVAAGKALTWTEVNPARLPHTSIAVSLDGHEDRNFPPNSVTCSVRFR